MLALSKLKAECRAPISRRKNAKSLKGEKRPLVQMAANKIAPKKSSKCNTVSRNESIGRIKCNEEHNNNLENAISGHTEAEEIKNLKELLLANLELVQKQQEVIGSKEKQIVELKRENETLRCRLERIDRRVSLKEKAATSSPAPLVSSSNEAVPSPMQDERKIAMKRKGSFEPHSLAKKFVAIAKHDYEREKMRDYASDSDNAPSKRSPRKALHLAGNLKKRSLKNRLKQLKRRDVNTTRLRMSSHKPEAVSISVREPRSIRSRQHVTTPQKQINSDDSESGNESDDLISVGNQPDSAKKSARHNAGSKSPRKNRGETARTRRKLRIPKDENILKTPIEYYVPQESETAVEVKPRKPAKEDVSVPTFRIKTFTPYYVIDGRENFEDEVYLERHKKPENEEKKRKRWDLQQQREEEQRRKLLSSQRYQDQRVLSNSNKEAEKNNNTDFSTLLPDPSKVEYIEVCDELPVSVFGYPLPNINKEDFALPWFDVEKREKAEECKKLRSRKR